MKISFCLITLNEATNLERSLASCVAVADEIIVLDSGSTDGTRRIADAFGARWHESSWPGYVEQKNRALGLAMHPWVFSLDADEALSPALLAAVAAAKSAHVPEALGGYAVCRVLWFNGQRIRYGDWRPSWLPRLVRRERARFAGGRVHERLIVDGTVRPLAGDLEHYSFRDWADQRARSESYARLWAESRHAAGGRASALDAPSHAAFTWARGYLMRGGVLEGPLGLRIANACARETARKYALLRDLARAQVPGPA